MTYTLGEAAKATGKSKPTISRAIKKGVISGKKNHNGEYILDESEVHRVWPMLQVASNDTITVKQSETDSNNNVLQHEIEMLRERLADKEQIIEDLREDRQHWREQAQAISGLLPDNSSQKGFFRKLFG